MPCRIAQWEYFVGAIADFIGWYGVAKETGCIFLISYPDLRRKTEWDPGTRFVQSHKATGQCPVPSRANIYNGQYVLLTLFQSKMFRCLARLKKESEIVESRPRALKHTKQNMSNLVYKSIELHRSRVFPKVVLQETNIQVFLLC